MKKILFLVFVSVAFASCNNGGQTPGQKLDTLLKKADTLADKVDTVAGKAWDSTKSKVRQLDDKIDNALRKDTTKR